MKEHMRDTKEEPRAPLLSEAELDRFLDMEDHKFLESDGPPTYIRVRDFYEDLITSGELMVVKTAPHKVETEYDVRKGWKAYVSCPNTRFSITVKYAERSNMSNCPGCGAKITP